MDITLDKKTTTEALIKITLKEADYQPKVEQKVKEYSKQAQIKGFRKGKVPTGLVRKMYGKSILVDEINHLLSHTVNDYIKEHKLAILGEPIPNLEKSEGIDWDTQKEFEFEYDIGLVGDFVYDLSKKVKVQSYKIKIDDKSVDEEVEQLRKNYGDRLNPETVEKEDLLHGEISQDESELSQPANLFLEHMEASQVKKFVGAKKEDTVSFDINQAFKSEEVKARILNKPPEEVKQIKGIFNFRIENITRMQPAELKQPLFDRLFGKDMVKTVPELKDRLKGIMEENYIRDTENFLLNQIRDKLVESTKLELPDAFLKRWLLISNQGKLSEEALEKEYDQYSDEMKWSLISNKIAEDHEIKVEHEDVVVKAKELITSQLASSGMNQDWGDQLDTFADNYLKGEEGQNYMKVFNQVRGEKVFEKIQEKVTIKEKEVSVNEFREIATG